MYCSSFLGPWKKWYIIHYYLFLLRQGQALPSFPTQAFRDPLPIYFKCMPQWSLFVISDKIYPIFNDERDYQNLQSQQHCIMQFCVLSFPINWYCNQKDYWWAGIQNTEWIITYNWRIPGGRNVHPLENCATVTGTQHQLSV